MSCNHLWTEWIRFETVQAGIGTEGALTEYLLMLTVGSQCSGGFPAGRATFAGLLLLSFVGARLVAGVSSGESFFLVGVPARSRLGELSLPWFRQTPQLATSVFPEAGQSSALTGRSTAQLLVDVG